jgi:hypothetical protein
VRGFVDSARGSGVVVRPFIRTHALFRWLGGQRRRGKRESDGENERRRARGQLEVRSEERERESLRGEEKSNVCNMEARGGRWSGSDRDGRLRFQDTACKPSWLTRPSLYPVGDRKAG